jgi:hypothetical protein
MQYNKSFPLTVASEEGAFLAALRYAALSRGLQLSLAIRVPILRYAQAAAGS